MAAVTGKSGLKGSRKEWMQRHIRDPYVKAANLQAYRSRAAFKLLEMDEKLKLIFPRQRVVDVGCAPGGWC
jgi:23S rRNA (uridine2552-2'-O)-methyltransferase